MTPRSKRYLEGNTNKKGYSALYPHAIEFMKAKLNNSIGRLVSITLIHKNGAKIKIL